MLTADQKLAQVLIEVFTTPIVYHPGGWEDTVADWMKARAVRERLDKVLNGGWEEATDAEVACYLYTASLAQPLTRTWAEIYFFVVAKLMPQVRDVIADTPQELDSYQQSELQTMKLKIRASQRKNLKQRKKEVHEMPKRKVVLDERDDSVMVAIGQEGCDPIVKKVEGTLQEALGTVPQLLQDADEQWKVSPRNPAHKAPAAPKTTPASTPTTGTSRQTEDLPLLAGAQPKGDAQAKVQTEERTEEVGTQTAETVVSEAETTGEASGVPQVETTGQPASEAGAGQPLKETRFQPRDSVEYVLADGQGPYATVQEAMDAMGLPKDKRPQHNRWDRLSNDLKAKILPRKK